MPTAPIARVVVAPGTEGMYYDLWTDAEGPPPATLTTALHARPVYMHRVGARENLCPVVTTTPGKLLRPTGSPALGPNSYLFAGQVVAREYLGRHGDWEPEGTRHLAAIVDCGLPLHFAFTHRECTVPVRSCMVPSLAPEDMAPGAYVAGLAHLSEVSSNGLYQPVTGVVRGMQVLGLTPEEEGFGVLRDVPFGYRLALDPDTVRVRFVFMTLDVLSVGPLEHNHDCGLRVFEVRIDLRASAGAVTPAHEGGDRIANRGAMCYTSAGAAGQPDRVAGRQVPSVPGSEGVSRASDGGTENEQASAGRLT